MSNMDEGKGRKDNFAAGYFSLPISTRKHNLPSDGSMEFTNGFGTRWDCHMCTRGLTQDGSTCSICGPFEHVPT